jgi:hypothetical protein
LIQLATRGDYQARLGGWSGRTDPDGNIYNFVACNAPLNDLRYCNAEVDHEVDAARAVEDPPNACFITAESPNRFCGICRYLSLAQQVAVGGDTQARRFHALPGRSDPPAGDAAGIDLAQ